MDTNPHIRINEAPTNDGGDDGNDLLQCYFQELGKSNTFHFFQPDGKHIITRDGDGIPSPLRNGHHFSFHFNGLEWSVPLFAISRESLMAIGAWTNLTRADQDDPTANDPESGTFQAQAGLGEEGELKAKALASS